MISGRKTEPFDGVGEKEKEGEEEGETEEQQLEIKRKHLVCLKTSGSRSKVNQHWCKRNGAVGPRLEEESGLVIRKNFPMG